MVIMEDLLNKNWIAAFSVGQSVLILVAATLVPFWAVPTTHNQEGQRFFICLNSGEVSHVPEEVLGRVWVEEETRHLTVIIFIVPNITFYPIMLHHMLHPLQ